MSEHTVSLGPAPADTHAAITDMLYRAVLSFDTGDVALLHSALTDDATFTLSGVEPFKGRETIEKKLWAHVATMDTVHYLTNIRVNLTSDTTAKVTCNNHAFHYRQGEGTKPGSDRFVGGGIYFVDAVKDAADGLWKCKDWTLKLVFTEGNRDIMTPSH